jgi:Holliday junction DNA helicase RuvA
MISYIQGKIVECKPSALIILAGGLGYEVLVPPAILAALPHTSEGDEVSLIIYYYLQIDQSRGMPVMIGFRNALEREFFEQFIQVASIGPRTAVKAIAQPIQKIASAIEGGDMRFLNSLPGVGRQKAKEIVAKLQGKMGAYCLLDGGEVVVPSTTQDAVNGNELEAEALAVLLQLQYTRNDAQQMIKRAIASTPPPTTTEEVLELIYRQGRG